MKEITKVVIPAAGLGTRFLPATKALPKEMLPIVDKPAIQYVVEEAVAAGLHKILMVTGRNKNALENHFDRAVELENILRANGNLESLYEALAPTDLAEIHYVRQGDPRGLGHAILKSKTFVGDEPFVVMLGDDIVTDSADLLEKMIELAEQYSASVVALMKVLDEDLSKYGVAQISEPISEGVVWIENLLEKPTKAEAPSNFAVIGRYVLQPGVFDVIDGLEPGNNGEIQLTDALAKMSTDPLLAGPVIGVIFSGRRYDTGDRLSFLKATVEIAVGRPDVGRDFTSWLKNFVGSI